jgi:hypothetical protein
MIKREEHVAEGNYDKSCALAADMERPDRSKASQ